MSPSAEPNSRSNNVICEYRNTVRYGHRQRSRSTERHDRRLAGVARRRDSLLRDSVQKYMTLYKLEEPSYDIKNFGVSSITCPLRSVRNHSA